MGIAMGCTSPHPPIIIPEIGRENLVEVKSTVDAMKRLASEIASAEPDSIVVVSPHSTGFFDSIAIKDSPILKGSFWSFGEWSVAFSVKNDVDFAEAVIEAAEDANIPMARITHQYTELTSKEELDHGIMVPLYYIFKEIEVPIVSLAISYLGFEKHYSLGIAVRRASDILNRRAVYLASGDLSHRLTPGAPAGYNPRGEEFDNLLVNLVRTGDFAGLLSIDRDLAESAGECGLRPIISLAGLFNGYDVQTDVLSYEGPFGVGYLVSTVREKAPNRARDILTDKSME